LIDLILELRDRVCHLYLFYLFLVLKQEGN